MTESEIIESIIPFIDEFKANSNLELEGSIGVFDGSKYTSGVDFNYFKALYTAFSSFETSPWSKKEEKSKFASYVFHDQIRGRYEVKEKPVFVRKTALRKCDLKCTQRSYDIRLSLKQEVPLSNFIAKTAPDFVRLQERWSFTYKDSWRYDFTKVAAGTTKELACSSQPVFEIEFEVLRHGHYFQSISSREAAQHIVEKLTDLLGRFDSNYRPLPISLEIAKLWSSSDNAIGTTS